jgi:hypothetical protein
LLTFAADSSTAGEIGSTGVLIAVRPRPSPVLDLGASLTLIAAKPASMLARQGIARLAERLADCYARKKKEFACAFRHSMK